MALSKDTKYRLDMAMGSNKAADALLAKIEANAVLSKRELRELEIAMADKKAAAEIARDLLAELAEDISNISDAEDAVEAAQDALDAYEPAVAAEAVLDLTADITLTSAAKGAARNGDTFTLQVLAAAANDDDEVLAAFTGTADAIVLTITPNDGTNNSATPVDLTTAELAELINTGAVVGKNVVLADSSSLRELQTAAGGDATALADAGEGDGEVATFANGADESDDLEQLEEALAEAQAALAAAKAASNENKVSKRSEDVMAIALADKEAASELKAAIEE
jgi:hypothetical protein